MLMLKSGQVVIPKRCVNDIIDLCDAYLKDRDLQEHEYVQDGCYDEYFEWRNQDVNKLVEMIEDDLSNGVELSAYSVKSFLCNGRITSYHKDTSRISPQKYWKLKNMIKQLKLTSSVYVDKQENILDFFDQLESVHIRHNEPIEEM